MSNPSDGSFDTREFVSRWNAATEEHLMHQVRQCLERLGSRGIVPGLTGEQVGGMSPVLLHALQVAAAPDGGVHAAIQYLATLESGGDQAHDA